jgi:hypothetical protein
MRWLATRSSTASRPSSTPPSLGRPARRSTTAGCCARWTASPTRCAASPPTIRPAACAAATSPCRSSSRPSRWPRGTRRGPRSRRPPTRCASTPKAGWPTTPTVSAWCETSSAMRAYRWQARGCCWWALAARQPVRSARCSRLRRRRWWSPTARWPRRRPWSSGIVPWRGRSSSWPAHRPTAEADSRSSSMRPPRAFGVRTYPSVPACWLREHWRWT